MKNTIEKEIENRIEKEIENTIEKENQTTIFFGCKQTKVFCDKTCKSKCAMCPDVILFFSVKEGLDANYTPCMRCQPDVEIKCVDNKHLLIQKAKNIMEENYKEKFSLQSLATKIYINEDYLGRIFKSIVGHTPLEYHHFVRCENARKILEENDYNIGYVANLVGYISESHFIKIFKSLYGITPLKYKVKSKE